VVVGALVDGVLVEVRSVPEVVAQAVVVVEAYVDTLSYAEVVDGNFVIVWIVVVAGASAYGMVEVGFVCSDVK
jgi:hypothetical protein